MGPPRAALVMVGDELLNGRKVDTNGPWLARSLEARGVEVVGLEAVPDDAVRIAETLERAARGADLVLVSGGLGPTPDDLTREGLARALGVDLLEDEGALRSISLVLSQRGQSDLDAPRRRQARIPRGARWLPNAEGTAPGIEARIAKALILVLPGVPRELRAMFGAVVVPALERRGGGRSVAVSTIPTAGIPEAEISHRLADLDRPRGVQTAFYPHEGEVEVRLLGRGEDAGVEVAALEAEIRRRLGPAAWPAGRIESEVVRLLRERGLRVTTAESVTGGLVARMLTRVPGASHVFRGGWVTYSDAWKTGTLGVSADLLRTCGAVSAEVAQAMAERARVCAGVEAAVATTGIAGPGDGRAPDGRPIPQGTYYAAASLAGHATDLRSRLLPVERAAVQRRAAVDALDLLRLRLQSEP